MKRILSMVLAVLMVAFAVPALAESAETTVPKYVFMFIGDGNAHACRTVIFRV